MQTRRNPSLFGDCMDRVAELVTIASPGNLFSAIRKAEQVELACSLPTWVAPSNSHEDLDGAVEAGDHAGGLLLPKLTHRLRPLRSSRR